MFICVYLSCLPLINKTKLVWKSTAKLRLQNNIQTCCYGIMKQDPIEVSEQ